MQRKLLIGVGLALLFILTFVIAVCIVFPMDSVRHFIEKSLETKVFKGAQSVEISDLSISPLLNITAKNVTMNPRSVEPVPENMKTAGGEFSGYYCPPAVEIMPVTIDELFVDPSLFASIKGDYSGTLNLKLAGGEIDATLETISRKAADSDEKAENANDDDENAPKAKTRRNRNRDKDKDEAAEGEEKDTNDDSKPKSKKAKKTPAKDQYMNVTAKGQRISLGDFALIGNKTGMTVYGEMDFDGHVVLHNTELESVNATLNLLNTALCPKRIKLPMGSNMTMDLPFIMLGDVEADLEMSDKTVKINKFTSTGPDIKLDITGDFTLPKRAGAKAKLNITAHIEPSEEWVETNSMDIIYQLCRRNADGSIDMKLEGQLGKLKPDCGTPIPVEKPVVEKKDESKKDEAKKDEAKKDEPNPEKKDEPNPEKKKEVAEALPPAPMPEKVEAHKPPPMEGDNPLAGAALPNRGERTRRGPGTSGPGGGPGGRGRRGDFPSNGPAVRPQHLSDGGATEERMMRNPRNRARLEEINETLERDMRNRHPDDPRFQR